uniref:Sec-independent protein translocase component TatC n=1 Tax=Gloiopeltis furcata TaxID=42017 RepID=A0A5A4ST20_9FLOR|nr:Sec-independent protein translocase component TatC [Gloiopeltis furcata]BBK20791.1 Sec-independent protein translocase component TatC [Gloiopeltis furcata]
MSQVYVREMYYRCFYVFVSFSFSACVSFWCMHPFPPLETYPLLKSFSGRFIATQVTELIDTSWVLILTAAFDVTFPMFFYQMIQFSRNGWYNYQFYFAQKLFVLLLLSHWLFFLFCYVYLFPGVLAFFSQWEVSRIGSILNVDVEFKIMSYINWVLVVWSCLSFLLGLFGTFILHILFFFCNEQNIYKTFKLSKKQIFFITPCSIRFFLTSFRFTDFVFYWMLFLFCMNYFSSSPVIDLVICKTI